MDIGRGAGDLYSLSGFHEPFSALSHLSAAALFLVLGILLLRRGRGSGARLAFLGVYAAACVLLFSLSGVYHMLVRGGDAHAVLGRLDHSAIFVLIAGTFTPVHGLLFRGPLRWGPLLMIWSAAAAGITLKAIYYDDVAEWLGLAFYLALGWIGTFSAALLARRYGVRFLMPAIWGGAAYSIGAILDLLRWPVIAHGVIHAHEVFHVAVLIGAICHWVFIWRFAAGAPRGATRPDAAHSSPHSARFAGASPLQPALCSPPDVGDPLK